MLLYVAGDDEQPCGYFPGAKATGDGDVVEQVTGRWEDDGGFGYATFREPVLYVAIWPNQDAVVKGGRVMWPQSEEGS